MQFTGRRRKLTVHPQNELYGHCLQLYGQPPLENISLSEFETFAVERLKLLKTVENLGVSYVKMSEQYSKKLHAEISSLHFPHRPEVDESSLNKSQAVPTEYEKRRKDHISHFILRLAYCQTEDLRRWFIQQEMDLFRHRFTDLPPKFKTEFLHRNNLKYDTISVEEKKNLKDQLINSSYGFSGTTVVEQDFYKVPFQDALDLVRMRKVFLQGGYAYIPHQEIVTIVLNDFRTRLSKALALTARSLPAVQSDERLQPLLNHLSHAYVGQDYSIQKNIGKVSLEQIDALSAKSFPLCMRQLHKALRDNHHLRHGGRMQYGLFLKGIGLTLEQALQFWRSEFIRGKVDADKFDKAYAYSIRHMFGKEGKRTDYTPYSCMKVILSNPPSQGDYHGCPFRHSDPELLKQKLQSYKLSPSGIVQILDLVKGMHYQLACQKYFELTHNIEDAGFSLNHPNQYFMESQKLLGGGREIKKEVEMPQKVQENTTANGASVQPQPNTTQAMEEMGDLDSYFLDE
ncbi:DNA primase large subunit [Colossoma macropomum]|uniref:DNA primase large subunit n=1 Tax=Colossoma macropomum TaxID=42526 RepID=UPI00186516B7|nr:DNA primase large subunit [Colossoma macropomum]XP_036430323.1 DNA primase large subunit [Colossoma macropomum]